MKSILYALAGALAAVLMTTTSALAGSGVGSVFNLGALNTVDAPTILKGNPGANPQVRLVNGGSGAGLRAESQTGIGLNGVSVSGTGQQGQSASGIGLFGTHTDATGTNPGVQGQTNSTDPNGAGVLGKNTGGGPGLRSIVNVGAPPLAVNSPVKVTNLNADLLDGFDALALQKRVTGTCPSGQAIRVINADGTVACETAFGGGTSGWGLTGNAGTSPGTNFLGTTDNQPLVFKTNGSEGMRLDATGALGLGTTSPSEKLDVTGNVRVAPSILESQGFENPTFPPSGWATSGDKPWVRDTSTFFSGTASAQSGYPLSTFQVSGLTFQATLPRAGTLTFEWKAAVAAGHIAYFVFCYDVDFCDQNTAPYRLLQTTDWAKLVLEFPAGTHTFMWGYLDPDGGSGRGWLDDVHFVSGGDLTVGRNVGIDVSQPTHILEVQQNSPTDPIADSWTTYSSRRWKTDIHTIGSALGLLERLRGVSFRWKETGKRDLGLIAEEVDRVLPGIVAHDQAGHASGLDYARLVPVLIEGVKEQQRTLERQGRQNVALRAQLKAQNARLTKLEHAFSARSR